MHGDDVVFVTLPEMLVNIQGPEGRPAYLKLTLTLEAPDDETVAALGEHLALALGLAGLILHDLPAPGIWEPPVTWTTEPG